MALSISIVQGDITKLSVDAIVNAANEELRAGSGVCGAIHKAAGPMLEMACLEIGFCKTGDAVMTDGFMLNAKFVIHAVGPHYFKHGENAPKLLESCYQKSLELADENNISSVAFPAISTGIYGYPILEATKTAVRTVKAFQPKNRLSKVIFCCFSERDRSIYESLLKEQDKKGSSH